VPLTNLPSGTVVPVIGIEGDWLLIRFDDRRWGSRVGYIHCANLRPQAATPANSEPVLLSPPATGVAAAPIPAEPVDLTIPPREQPGQTRTEPIDLSIEPRDSGSQAGRRLQERAKRP
jgi:hypothetical protein